MLLYFVVHANSSMMKQQTTTQALWTKFMLCCGFVIFAYILQDAITLHQFSWCTSSYICVDKSYELTKTPTSGTANLYIIIKLLYIIHPAASQHSYYFIAITLMHWKIMWEECLWVYIPKEVCKLVVGYFFVVKLFVTCLRHAIRCCCNIYGVHSFMEVIS